jgi:hypothetical protein
MNPTSSHYPFRRFSTSMFSMVLVTRTLPFGVRTKCCFSSNRSFPNMMPYQCRFTYNFSVNSLPLNHIFMIQYRWNTFDCFSWQGGHSRDPPPGDSLLIFGKSSVHLQLASRAFPSYVLLSQLSNRMP